MILFTREKHILQAHFDKTALIIDISNDIVPGFCGASKGEEGSC